MQQAAQTPDTERLDVYADRDSQTNQLVLWVVADDQKLTLEFDTKEELRTALTDLSMQAADEAEAVAALP